jgi:hypothetical protein
MTFCRAVRRRWDEIYELKAARSMVGGASRPSGLPPTTPLKNASLQMGRNPFGGNIQQSVSVPTLVPIVESTNGNGGVHALQQSVNAGSPTKGHGGKPKATIDDITILLSDLTSVGAGTTKLLK